MAKGKLVRVHVLYIVVAAAVGGSFYISIIYCLTVAGKFPFLALHFLFLRRVTVIYVSNHTDQLMYGAQLYSECPMEWTVEVSKNVTK